MAVSSSRRGSFALGALLASLLVLAMAPAVRASTWKVQHLPFPPDFPGQEYTGPLLGISCASASSCVAVGSLTRIAASTNPAGGPAAWDVFFGPEGGDYSGPPAPPGAPPNRQRPNLAAVACPTVGLCVAVSASGDVYTSTSPTSGAGAWTRTDVDGDEYDTHLESVSCPTSSFCVAVSGGEKQHANPRTSGKILYSRDPTGGSSAWHETQLDPSYDLRGVSCSSPSMCLAVGQDGRMLVSADPDGPASAWHDLGTPGGPGHLDGVSCVIGLCLAGNSGGNLLANIDPSAASAIWAKASGGASVPITGVSCASPSRCLAVDDNGDVMTSSDPGEGVGAWSIQNVLPYVPKPGYEPTLNGMFAVSCPSVEFCAIAAADGTVLTSTDPFAEAAPTPTRRGKRRAKRPRTIIARVDRGGRVRTDKARLRVLFRFYSKGGPRKFLCNHDAGRWRSCRSPHRYWARHGDHVFRVRAVGYTGLRGPIASAAFRIHTTDDKCPCRAP